MMSESDQDSPGPILWWVLGGMTVAFLAYLLMLSSGFDISYDRAPQTPLVAPNPKPGDSNFVDLEDEEDIEQLLEILAEDVPHDFLETDYEPLAKWLGERFEVNYKHMTPNLIFDQVPLNDIFYEVADLPTRNESFDFRSEGLSRRELLKKIADHWDLKMTFNLDESGTPSAIRVKEK